MTIDQATQRRISMVQVNVNPNVCRAETKNRTSLPGAIQMIKRGNNVANLLMPDGSETTE
jgi:hypothetical protein